MSDEEPNRPPKGQYLLVCEEPIPIALILIGLPIVAVKGDLTWLKAQPVPEELS
jgi:hypothetical protein